MNVTRGDAMIVAAGTVAAASAFGASTAPAAAGADGPTTFVQVNMRDRGVDVIGAFDMSNRIMLGTPGAAHEDDAGAPMGSTLTQHVVPHGTVKFIATNTSTFEEHELLVLPIKDVTTALPYNTDTERLDEDAAGSLGEISETEPGEAGELTLDLAPGTYMLACNIPNHDAMGMRTLITVI